MADYGGNSTSMPSVRSGNPLREIYAILLTRNRSPPGRRLPRGRGLRQRQRRRPARRLGAREPQRRRLGGQKPVLDRRRARGQPEEVAS